MEDRKVELTGSYLQELEYYSESGYEIHYGYEDDAGLDLPVWDARHGEEITFQPGEAITLKTGVYMAIPKMHYGEIDTRSSTSELKMGLLCRTIDNPFRGNIRLALINHNSEPVTVKQGQCLCQIIVKPYAKMKPKKVSDPSELEESVRGENGFGSTGRNG